MVSTIKQIESSLRYKSDPIKFLGGFKSVSSYSIEDNKDDTKTARMLARQAIKHYGLKRADYLKFIAISDLYSKGRMPLKKIIKYFYEDAVCEFCDELGSQYRGSNYLSWYNDRKIDISSEFMMKWEWGWVYLAHPLCVEKAIAHIRIAV